MNMFAISVCHILQAIIPILFHHIFLTCEGEEHSVLFMVVRRPYLCTKLRRRMRIRFFLIPSLSVTKLRQPKDEIGNYFHNNTNLSLTLAVLHYSRPKGVVQCYWI